MFDDVTCSGDNFLGNVREQEHPLLIVLIPSLDNEAGRTEFFHYIQRTTRAVDGQVPSQSYAYNLARGPQFRIS
jgi:hypothetical protein